jgi:predicted aldo/keto reductase-like oxidoreductase
MSQEELDLIAQARDAYMGFNAIPCTKCGYCMPCPNGLDIPRNFELYNEAVMHNSPSLSQNLYTWHMVAEQRAESCTACRECEEQCPQQIEISAWMPRVHEALIIKEEAS